MGVATRRLERPFLSKIGSPELQLALDCAREGGLLIAKAADKQQESASSQVLEKSGRTDIVTLLDIAIDTLVRRKIGEMYPDDPILSEESSPDERGDGGRLWVVDPLDSTMGFHFRMGERIPSVMIALREGTRTKLAVILFPLTGDYFFAEDDKRVHGVYKGSRNVTLSQPRSLEEGRVEMNHYGNSAYETEAFAYLNKALRSERGPRLVTSNVPYSGIVADLIERTSGLVAVVHDNNPESVKQGPHDIIPAKFLLEKAGGVAVTLEGGEVDPFTPEPFIMAVNEEVAYDILALLD